MEQFTQVKKSTKKALGIAIKNDADIRKIEQRQQSLKEEITKELKYSTLKNTQTKIKGP